MTVKTPKSLRTDDHFTVFLGLAIKAQQDVDVCDPELPRRRKAPKRYDDGAPADFPVIARHTFGGHILRPSAW